MITALAITSRQARSLTIPVVARRLAGPPIPVRGSRAIRCRITRHPATGLPHTLVRVSKRAIRVALTGNPAARPPASNPGIRAVTRDPATATMAGYRHTRRRITCPHNPAEGSRRRTRSVGRKPGIPGAVRRPHTPVGVSSPCTRPRARRPAIRRQTVGPPATHRARRRPWSSLSTVGLLPTPPSPAPPRPHWRPGVAVGPGPGHVPRPAGS